MTKRLRLIGKGFENYTGAIGVTQFVEGLSVGTPHQMDVHRLTCTIGARWDDGSASSVGEGYEAAKNAPAPTVEEQVAADNAAVAAAAGPGVTYTHEQLAAVADKDGIAGLRQIAEPLGIKASSIKGLIDGIIKVAGAVEAADDPAPAADAEGEVAKEGEAA